MKKSLIFGLALLFFSCGEDDNSKIEGLKPVAFSETPNKILSRKKTGKAEYNPATNVMEYEYLKEVEKSKTLFPLSFGGIKDTDVIFPGSILRGSTFLEGTYDPIVSSAPFKNITLSVTLRGKDYPVKDECKPILSEVRRTFNSLLAKHIDEINTDFVPAYLSYMSDNVNTVSSFNKSLNIHANANILSGLISAKFNYVDKFKSSHSKKHVMIRMEQIFYSATIDTKHYSSWFEEQPNVSDFGTHEPLYVSNVDYGRIAYLLLETESSAEEAQKIISGGINFAFSPFSAGASASYNQQLKNMFNQSKIRIYIVGGPGKLGGKVTSYDQFIEFIKTPDIQDLISSAAPISYKIRRLKDNTEVEVKSLIVEKELEMSQL